MNERIEMVVLRNLLNNEDYVRRVLPFLKEEYFADSSDKILFREVSEFINKYNKSPSIEAVKLEISSLEKISETDIKKIETNLDIISKSLNSEDNMDWLIDQSEKFCKDKAIFNAIMDSIHIIDGKTEESVNVLPEILSKALSVSFDTNIGHDFIENKDERFEFYHRIEEKVPFDLDYMNRITNGGVPNKTLNVILASTGVGKSLFLCHHTTNCLIQNKNVLYITCEMSEERIAERIDANLLNTPIQDLKKLSKELYDKKMERALKNIKGRLIVKEYPTATANVSHFRNLINELRLKKNFSPDVLMVDYLNICASARFKGNTTANSYTYVKSIAEELRGLAVELDIPIFTATQANRGGYNNSDIDLSNTSESYGLPSTADLLVALIATEELEELSQIMVKQLKNRYNDPSTNKKFVLGIDRSKMRLYDVEEHAQNSLVDSGQLGSEMKKTTDKLNEKFTKNSSFDDWEM
jgi:replicative DNA helicase